MQVQITKQAIKPESALFELVCGKQSAHIWVTPHYTMVCNLNASHRAWGGLGKRFDSLQDAMAGYKSAAMRAMIQTAAEAIA